MKVLQYSPKVWVPIAVFLVGVATSLLLFQLLNPKTAQEVLAPTPSQLIAKEPDAVAPGLPVRLKIPKINVDAPVESLGLTSQGDLDAPKGFENVGWYNAGARPGAIGSAVMDGHFGRADNKPAVFDKLHTLQKGDLLHIEDGKKETFTFVVKELISYRADDDASAVFRSNDKKSHLNLITCQGAWNKGQASYSNRLIVFADLVKE